MPRCLKIPHRLRDPLYSHNWGVTNEAITWKISNISIEKYTFLDWKNVKEANSHINFLPKNLNFKKIIKNRDFHVFFYLCTLKHILNLKLLKIGIQHAQTYVQRQICYFFNLSLIIFKKMTFLPKN